eukprot:c54604_g1_i1 orf=71-526(+)
MSIHKSICVAKMHALRLFVGGICLSQPIFHLLCIAALSLTIFQSLSSRAVQENAGPTCVNGLSTGFCSLFLLLHGSWDLKNIFTTRPGDALAVDFSPSAFLLPISHLQTPKPAFETCFRALGNIILLLSYKNFSFILSRQRSANSLAIGII